MSSQDIFDWPLHSQSEGLDQLYSEPVHYDSHFYRINDMIPKEDQFDDELLDFTQEQRAQNLANHNFVEYTNPTPTMENMRQPIVDDVPVTKKLDTPIFNQSDSSKNEEPSPSPEVNNPPNQQNWLTITNLITIIFKMFTRQKEIVEASKVSKQQKRIIEAFIQRKFQLRTSFKSDQEDLLLYFIEMFDSETSKRPEEKYKYVFKRALKLMKDKFKKSRLDLINERQPIVTRAFFDHYFKEISQKEGIPLERFEPPRFSGAKKNSNSVKTLNAEYIRLVKKTPAFVTHFLEACEKLREKAPAVIKSKFDSLRSKFSQFKSENDTKTADRIVEYITKNNKCKLPWTLREVESAVDSVYQLFGFKKED